MTKQATVTVHGPPGHSERRPGAPVVSSIAQSSTFFWADPADGQLRYTRYGNNPNQLEVAAKVAALEGTEDAVVLASGMAATAMTFLALAEAGDHIVASIHLYGATVALLRDELPRRGIEVTFVDPIVDGVKAIAWALRDNTRLVHVELPTNPTLRVIDPRPIADLVHPKGIALSCDATFASPANMRVAETGVDVAIQSATKYMGGHSDLIAGTVAGSNEVVERVTEASKLYGPTVDPHTAWLLDRGLRTLSVRMERHNSTAMQLARWFGERDEVATVIYPGLPEHPDHSLAGKLLAGFGGMVSIVLEGGGEAADRFVRALTVAIAAPSLGGVETLVSQPRYTSHGSLSPEARLGLGIPDGFVRISVGLEDPEDLKADFNSALRQAGRG